MKQALTRCWHGDCPFPWRFALPLLAPFSWLFRFLVAGRRWLYRLGVFKSARLPVPVVVVGNITVGGAGKTPLTLALVAWLRQAGFKPGVVSRGYGGAARVPMPVSPDSDPALVGDEPVLIARRAGCPVWIGRARAEAGRRLLDFHPEVDVLLTDDGLQHYALGRDMEIAVVDGERGLGNRRLLPAGPLREPPARLSGVDAMVVNGGGEVALTDVAVPRFAMALTAREFVNLRHPERRVAPEAFRGGRVHALAGIGHPERFFASLEALGLTVERHPFADHHAYVAADLPDGTLVMTEKDAVKCAGFAPEDAWFLAVDAEVEGGLNTLLLNTLKERHGSQVA